MEPAEQVGCMVGSSCLRTLKPMKVLQKNCVEVAGHV